MYELKEEDLNYADRENQYKNTVILYKGNPSYVSDVDGEDFLMLDLISQKKVVGKFLFKDMTPPSRRIGMVNLKNSAMYVTRQPVRRVQVGISKSSIITSALPWESDVSKMEMSLILCNLKSKELGLAMNGDYPTIADASRKAQDTNGCYAFDKQFAITAVNQIIYKTKVVGMLDGAAAVQNIVFDAGYSHLINLLDGNYEKTFRNS